MKSFINKYFVVTNCPDSPPIILAFYDNLRDAKYYCENKYRNSGYVRILQCEWVGYGPLPEISKMKRVKDSD